MGTTGPAPSSRSHPGLTLAETPIHQVPFAGADSKEVAGSSVGSWSSGQTVHGIGDAPAQTSLDPGSACCLQGYPAHAPHCWAAQETPGIPPASVSSAVVQAVCKAGFGWKLPIQGRRFPWMWLFEEIPLPSGAPNREITWLLL